MKRLIIQDRLLLAKETSNWLVSFYLRAVLLKQQRKMHGLDNRTRWDSIKYWLHIQHTQKIYTTINI